MEHHYPCQVALQQSPIPFDDEHAKLKGQNVYLQAVLIMGGVTISLQSIQGKVLMSENYMINSGDSTILLDMELLPAGIYIFQLELNEMLGTIKIVRQ